VIWRWKISLKRLLIKVGTKSARTSKVPADIKKTSGGDLQQNYSCKTFLLQLGGGFLLGFVFSLGGWLYREEEFFKLLQGFILCVCMCVAEN